MMAMPLSFTTEIQIIAAYLLIFKFASFCGCNNSTAFFTTSSYVLFISKTLRIARSGGQSGILSAWTTVLFQPDYSELNKWNLS